MKRLLLCAFSTVIAYSAYGSNFSAYCSDRVCCPPVTNGGLYVSALGYDLLASGTGPELDVESFQYQNFATNQFISAPRYFNSDYHWGYQVKLGYDWKCTNNNIELSYFHFSNSEPYDADLKTTNFNTLATYFYTNLVIPAFPTRFGDFFTGLTELNGHNVQKYKVDKFDITFGKNLPKFCGLRVRPSAGIRYAHLRRSAGGLITGVVGTGIGVPIPIDAISNRLIFKPSVSSDFKGTGPVFSLDTRYDYRGFGLVTHVDGALLVGKVKSLTTFDISFPPVADGGNPLLLFTSSSQAFNSPGRNRIVTSFEGRLGVDYCFQFCNCSSLTVEAGYFASKYFDTFDLIRGDVQSPLPTALTGFNSNQRITERVTDDFDLSGPYVNVTYHF